MDDTLQQLLAAENAARELVENAQKESDHLVQTALHEAHLQDERFQARVPEMRTSYIEKSDQRAAQTVAEMERRFHERFDQLRKDAETHEESALEAAFHELLGAGKQ